MNWLSKMLPSDTPRIGTLKRPAEGDDVDQFYAALSTAWRRHRPKSGEQPYYRSVPANRTEPVRRMIQSHSPVATTVGDWARTALQRKQKGSVRCVEARKAFDLWCQASGETPLNANSFGRQMTALGFRRKKKGGNFHYAGIVLTMELRAVS